jgi:replicative DNA helicase
MDKISRLKQEDLLSLLIFDDKSAKIIRNVVPIKLFEGFSRRCAEQIYGYIDQYGEAPQENVASLLEDDLGGGGTHAEKAKETLAYCYETRGKVRADFVLNYIQNFLRQQYLKEGIIKSAEKLQAGDEDSLNEAEVILTKAFKNRLGLFDAGTFLDDTARSFRFFSEDVSALPTGIMALDNYDLGPVVGGLHLFIGLPKRGKTWWLINVGRHCMMQGYKVCHITLEMPEHQIAQRYYQNFFALSKRDREIEQLRLDIPKGSTIPGFKTQNYKRPFTLHDDDAPAKLQQKITNLGNRVGNVVVKQFPTGRLTNRELEVYLDALEDQSHFKPDLLILDYADLMSIGGDIKNYRLALGRTYIDLRGIASERGLALATASQSSRQGMGEEGVSEATIAEDFSKVATADCVIAFNQTREEKRVGLARLRVTNARSDADNKSILITQNYNTGQFAMDHWLMPTFEKAYFDKLVEYGISDGEDDV